MKKKILCLALALLVVLSAACSGATPQNDAAPAVECTVSQDEKFGAAIFSATPEEIETAGFSLGDSCDVTFENGYELTDVPFYNGYYVKNEAPVMVAYPGFGNVRVTLNNVGIWVSAGLSDGMKVTITRNAAGKYSAIQDSLGQSYSFERKDYESDVQFSNFRAMTGGRLKEELFFRGASPVDNSRGRAGYVNALLEEQGIGFVIDLADSEEDMASYLAQEDFASDYTEALYNDGRMVLLDLSSAFQGDDFHTKLVDSLRLMMEADAAPVYIHCMEGKDRTGFVCMLLEALAGASYEEMRTDYMLTYQNYYGVSYEKTPEKYDAIAELYFDSFAAYLHGTEDTAVLRSADYAEDAKNYLRDGGMSEEELLTLSAWITE